MDLFIGAGSHYLWLKQFWTPTKESYAGYGEFVITSDLKHAYEEFHPDLPKFLKEAIAVFATKELS